MTPANVDDIVASVEDAVRRAYALGRSDAMKRVVELAQSDDTGLRAVALLNPPESQRAEPVQARLSAPQPATALQDHHEAVAAPPVQEHHKAAAALDAQREAKQDAMASGGMSPSTAPAPAGALAEAGIVPPPEAPGVATGREQPPRESPKSVGGFLADYFYPLGSKKR